jgi:hypothetical protein
VLYDREGSDRNDRQMLVHWLLFSGVSYCDNRECALIFAYDTKEIENQNQEHKEYLNFTIH